jgi:hypothetical protein
MLLLEIVRIRGSSQKPVWDPGWNPLHHRARMMAYIGIFRLEGWQFALIRALVACRKVNINFCRGFDDLQSGVRQLAPYEKFFNSGEFADLGGIGREKDKESNKLNI